MCQGMGYLKLTALESMKRDIRPVRAYPRCRVGNGTHNTLEGMAKAASSNSMLPTWLHISRARGAQDCRCDGHHRGHQSQASFPSGPQPRLQRTRDEERHSIYLSIRRTHQPPAGKLACHVVRDPDTQLSPGVNPLLHSSAWRRRLQPFWTSPSQPSVVLPFHDPRTYASTIDTGRLALASL